MGDTPLHVAAGHGHLEMIDLLLKYGADTTLKNNDGFTAEGLSSDASIKNAIQLSQLKTQCQYDNAYGYNDDEYNDDSD